MSPRPQVIAFLSHSDKDRHTAAQLKEKLEPFNIQVFLAHDDMVAGTDFVETLYEEIQKADIFIMLLSENYNSSQYTDQESGIAINAGIQIIPICIDETRPYGFAHSLHAIVCKESFDENTIKKIVTAVEQYTNSEPLKLDSLIEELENAESYGMAAALANRIAAYDVFSEKQINRLASALLENHEVYHSYIATPLIKKILWSNYDMIDPNIRSVI